MADTGYNWGNWAVVDAATVLTTGSTVQHTSAEIDLDGKAACEVSIDTDYSDHAKATGGLQISILRDVNGSDFEGVQDSPWTFEMPFLQINTIRRTFSVNPGQVSKFKIFQNWLNTTPSAVATTATYVRFATIPAAS